jgi:hypothetical protein
MAAANVRAICAIVAAFAVCDVAAQPAEAQFFLWPHFRPWWGDHAPRHKNRHKDADSRLTEKAPAKEKVPLQIVISLADQRISVYDGGTLIAQSSVSTGVPDHPTPSGVFSVIGKQLWHRSNLYSDAPMPYMQRITWSGIALHAGDLPGYPASHGCIRLEKNFAIRLWQMTKRGTRVIIAPNDVRPTEIADPHLPAFKAVSAHTPPKTAAIISDNAMTDTPAVPSLVTAANDPPQVIAEVPDSAPPRIAAAKPVPISIFVSRKSNRVFVRQGSKHLLEAPVTIQDPEESLGTHVFTLNSPRGDGANFHWTVVSIPEGLPRVVQAPAGRQKPAPRQMIESPAPESSPDKASAALGRIEMPPDAVERIAELLIPGSSLIVSDHGISRETARDTDFIVETQ